ncbi:MAG: cobalamin biosynthesis protein CbiX [Opitutaceae bacterium]|nr:cobalamin biosynthesis protein CbiX [Opitutaceae bacterium]
MKTLLVDNGSLEPAATFALRELATKLSDCVGGRIEPVSLLHSHKIASEKLDGVAAQIVEPYLREQLQAGENEFTVLPLFVGPSRAITEYLPEVIENLRADFPVLKVKIALTIYQDGDLRFVSMLADRVRDQLSELTADAQPVRVALVDHGSPIEEVTAVRNGLADQLASELGAAVEQVAPCSMERRAGSEYDFNEPLLESLLSREEWSTGTVIVTQLFLVPGRHAGPTGDIAQICADAEQTSPNLRTIRTEVLATHPKTIEILADRYALL